MCFQDKNGILVAAAADDTEVACGVWPSLSSLLQERINPTEPVQYKRSHPSEIASSASDGYNNN